MRKKVILITGASGEVGQALVNSLCEQSELSVITLDIGPVSDSAHPRVIHLQGDILDKSLLSRLVSEYEIDTIYHLAALLSTRSEFTPEAAHRVNVEGTLGWLQLAAEQSEWRNNPVKFIFPSSIAAYGLPPTWILKRSTLECANGNGIIPARCTAATSCIVNSLASTSVNTTASLLRIARSCLIFAVCASPA